MVTVEFASALQRHVPCPPAQLSAPLALADALDQALSAAPALRGYVLDDQGHIRKHVAVFINGHMHRNRQSLGNALQMGDSVYVVQCLTGG